MRSHWAFRRLADILSKSGFHVLRFDYFGTGDSSGEGIEANISQWKNDVGTAVRELADMSGTKAVSMVGDRLGAALAAQATIEGIRLKDLVLWDPVVIGRDYIGELRTLHQNLFSGTDGGPEKRGFTELVGYPFSIELVSEIEKINLLEQPHCKVEKVFIVVSEERREYLELARELKGRGTDFEYRFVPDSTDWANLEDFDQALLLNDIIHEIVTVIAGR
jgi:pimeloyl-ACP methyl ester carboxylesterase